MADLFEVAKPFFKARGIQNVEVLEARDDAGITEYGFRLVFRDAETLKAFEAAATAGALPPELAAFAARAVVRDVVPCPGRWKPSDMLLG